MRALFLAAGMLALLVTAAGSARADYEDEIGLQIKEVWPSAQKALKPFSGRVNEKKKTITTPWQQDQIVRRNKLLQKVTSRVYLRRYRLKIELTENYYFTKVKVSGTYQTKSVDATPAMAWTTMKSGTDEYILERSYFMKILNQLENDRLAKA